MVLGCLIDVNMAGYILSVVAAGWIFMNRLLTKLEKVEHVIFRAMKIVSQLSHLQCDLHDALHSVSVEEIVADHIQTHGDISSSLGAGASDDDIAQCLLKLHRGQEIEEIKEIKQLLLFNQADAHVIYEDVYDSMAFDKQAETASRSSIRTERWKDGSPAQRETWRRAKLVLQLKRRLVQRLDNRKLQLAFEARFATAVKTRQREFQHLFYLRLHHRVNMCTHALQDELDRRGLSPRVALRDSVIVLVGFILCLVFLWLAVDSVKSPSEVMGTIVVIVFGLVRIAAGTSTGDSGSHALQATAQEIEACILELVQSKIHQMQSDVIDLVSKVFDGITVGERVHARWHKFRKAAASPSNPGGLFLARVVEKQPVTGRYLLEYIEDESRGWVCRSEIATTSVERKKLERAEREKGVPRSRIMGKRVETECDVSHKRIGMAPSDQKREKLKDEPLRLSTEVDVVCGDVPETELDQEYFAGKIVSSEESKGLYTVQYGDEIWQTRPVRTALEKVEICVFHLNPHEYYASSHRSFLFYLQKIVGAMVNNLVDLITKKKRELSTEFCDIEKAAKIARKLALG
jgi:hypothetical protein